MTNLNKNIKLIVVDLDGTLLTSDKTITEFTKQTLEKCRRQGILTAIATARPIRVVDTYLDAVSPSARVYHNGGITFIKDEVISHCQIPAETAHEIVGKVQEKYPQIKIGCEYKDTLYANFDPSAMWSNVDYIHTDYSSAFPGNVDKLIMSVEEYPDFSNYIQSIIPPDIYVDVADNQIAYIMSKNATKHQALSQVLEHLNINTDNVACFGDDTPDIGMIKFCGVGIAMDNAKDSVKAVANFICESNDDDGVAKWLEQNILDKLDIR